MSPAPSTARHLVDGLEDLGVRTGDLVMVHASLRSVGPIEHGASGLLDALMTTLGATGTVLMVLGAHDPWSWVNDRPESERTTLLDDASPFDALTTPADPDVGALAEVFRTTRGTLVSDHPEGRFAASGRLAHHLTTAVPWHDYYGPGSPLERFVDAGGRVLRLGADRDTVTLIHYAEYLASLPTKRRVRRHRKVRSSQGTAIRVVECLDDSNGIVDHPGEDYFITILDSYLETGRANRGTVGRARSELIEGPDLLAFAVEWMERHLRPPTV